MPLPWILVADQSIVIYHLHHHHDSCPYLSFHIDNIELKGVVRFQFAISMFHDRFVCPVVDLAMVTLPSHS